MRQSTSHPTARRPVRCGELVLLAGARHRVVGTGPGGALLRSLTTGLLALQPWSRFSGLGFDRAAHAWRAADAPERAA